MLEDALYWTIAAIIGGVVVALLVRQRRVEQARVSRLAEIPAREAVVIGIEEGASRTRDWREVLCSLRFAQGEPTAANARIQVPIVRLAMVRPGASLLVRLSNDGSNQADVDWKASESLALVTNEATR